MDNHVNKQFDAELTQLRQRILEMGGLVQKQISDAIAGFVDTDLKKLDHVVETDAVVNNIHVEIDEECSQIISRRQPQASDLRYVMAAAKMVTDLERIGDEAKKIALKARLVRVRQSDRQLPLPKVGLRPSAEIALGMIALAMQAFACLDTKMVFTIAREDQRVDREFRGVIRQLMTFMLEDPRNISNAMEILLIAKAIERIGDHAKNMAEYIIYIVEGRDIRHVPIIEPDDEIELDDMS
ncbi:MULTISPECIES: phosphate signaling complex protein PhoU [Candidatus Ichthyocystis]|uniref:Phosphate-specific transport system accessory protein PhoU n=1 Tax=Candidatus Ichthyocystis hellenicum TaxID=1561003 RepID=A0A0S4M1C1_9BURK|nr:MULTISPECIES: phosphate signaling complex protein PhoU [Ichthyocystis]CUT17441.1 Phosphate transport system protein phoU [Candidatus Ichthyocystis hellenicum]